MHKSLLVASFFGTLQGCNPSSPVGPSDGGGTDTGVPSLCAKPTGSGTMHMTSVDTDTTWKAADSPHVISASMKVAQAATLTIEPCAEVRIQTGGITVEGKLIAKGDPSHRITITADDAAKPFTNIRSFGSMEMSSVDLSHGGLDDANSYGLIEVRQSNAMMPTPSFKAIDVSIDGAEQWGVSLRDNATFTSDSSGLTIKNAKLGPVRVEAPLSGSIPSGKYTGNTVDELLVIGNVPIASDTTWKDRGVPYRVGDTKGNGNDLRIGASTGSTLTTLTIESGVKVRVSKGGRIFMSNVTTTPTGALAATNVVFTSAEAAPAAGDWVGLYFAAPPASATKLDKVRVEYAGGPSQAKSFHCDLMGGFNEEEDSAIIILGFASSSFVTNSTIVASAGYGIDRGWYGATTDFVATNTFQDIANCKQSYPRDMNGACPMSVPCP